LLRRVKADVDLQIPPKKELLVYCPLSPFQQELYKATVNKTIEDLMGFRVG
jgi:ATP-dependent DNA helicase